MIAWVAHWWPWLLGFGGLAAFCVLAPMQVLAVLRWLVSTELGRAVLLLTAFGLFFLWLWTARNSALDAAEVARREGASLRTQVEALKTAAKHDDQSAAATDTARANNAGRDADAAKRADQREAIAHEPRPPVPAACPGPDPRVMRQLSEGRERTERAADRLRGLGRANGAPAR